MLESLDLFLFLNHFFASTLRFFYRDFTSFFSARGGCGGNVVCTFVMSAIFFNLAADQYSRDFGSVFFLFAMGLYCSDFSSMFLNLR